MIHKYVLLALLLNTHFFRDLDMWPCTSRNQLEGVLELVVGLVSLSWHSCGCHRWWQSLGVEYDCQPWRGLWVWRWLMRPIQNPQTLWQFGKSYQMERVVLGCWFRPFRCTCFSSSCCRRQVSKCWDLATDTSSIWGSPRQGSPMSWCWCCILFFVAFLVVFRINFTWWWPSRWICQKSLITLFVSLFEG